MRANIRFLDLLAILLVGLLWGLNWAAVKFLLTAIDPFTLRAVSFSFAALILTAVAILLKLPLRIPKGELIPIVVVGFFLIFGFSVLTSLGQILVEASKAAIIAYTMPSLTAVLAVVFLGDRISVRLILALMVAMIGLVILAFEDLSLLIEKPEGPTIMMLAALSWAVGNVALKVRKWTLPPLSLTVWFFLFSCLMIWPLAFVFENPLDQVWPSLPVLLTFGFHVLGPTVTCYLLWTILLQRLPATVAAISVLTAPVVGVLSAVLFLGEVMTWQRAVALAAIVLSIGVALIQPRQ